MWQFFPSSPQLNDVSQCKLIVVAAIPIAGSGINKGFMLDCRSIDIATKHKPKVLLSPAENTTKQAQYHDCKTNESVDLLSEAVPNTA